MRKTTRIIGSVSHGTMREDDLIPCFLDTIDELDPEKGKAIRLEYSSTIALLDEPSDELTEDQQEELSEFLNETLFNTLNEYAPPYFYFGSHPGDGSDYGFWLGEDFQEQFRDNGGLQVSDTSEVPKDYTGEVLHVSDHGNPTLYDACNGKLTEVWALV